VSGATGMGRRMGATYLGWSFRISRNWQPAESMRMGIVICWPSGKVKIAEEAASFLFLVPIMVDLKLCIFGVTKQRSTTRVLLSNDQQQGCYRKKG
jgi:hypothetical protein